MLSECSRCGNGLKSYPNGGLCDQCVRSLLSFILSEVHGDLNYVLDNGLQQATLDAVEIVQDLRRNVSRGDTQCFTP